MKKSLLIRRCFARKINGLAVLLKIQRLYQIILFDRTMICRILTTITCIISGRSRAKAALAVPPRA
jgi:hypothetical protein